MTPAPRVSLDVATDLPHQSALAEFLRTHTAFTQDTTADFHLTLEPDGLSLVSAALSGSTLRFDFLTSAVGRRAKQHQLIHRACALGRLPDPHILDATAGTGLDAWQLACAGARVTLVERQPLVFLLLQDALHRAHNEAHAALTVNRMQAVFADANEYLQSVDVPVDVVYLDPMFPATGKSALPGKAMQIFRELNATLPSDQDPAGLLDRARAAARYRVVVKRALKAPPLSDKSPSFVLKGRQIRFDVYSVRALP